MNFNTKETLIGLQCLGLDLETGKSTEILVKELEDLTGIRQVSNGSRIIRRDCATFSKFKYQISYGVNGEVISYTFNGYKDSSDLITEHSQDIVRVFDCQSKSYKSFKLSSVTEFVGNNKVLK